MRTSIRLFVVLALAVSVGLATAVSPFASSAPDGLNRVAEDHAFDDRGTLHAVQEDAPIPGYAFPGIGDERVAKGVAGFVGTLGVFAIGFGAAALLRRRATRDQGPSWPASATTPSS
jgi:hypothetical protein